MAFAVPQTGCYAVGEEEDGWAGYDLAERPRGFAMLHVRVKHATDGAVWVAVSDLDGERQMSKPSSGEVAYVREVMFGEADDVWQLDGPFTEFGLNLGTCTMLRGVAVEPGQQN